MSINPVLKGFVSLLLKRYPIEVITADYVKIDDKYDIYNMVLEVRLSDKMYAHLKELYPDTDTAKNVVWSEFNGKVQFSSEVGNNILLLLDSLYFGKEVIS